MQTIEQLIEQLKQLAVDRQAADDANTTASEAVASAAQATALQVAAESTEQATYDRLLAGLEDFKQWLPVFAQMPLSPAQSGSTPFGQDPSRFPGQDPRDPRFAGQDPNRFGTSAEQAADRARFGTGTTAEQAAADRARGISTPQGVALAERDAAARARGETPGLTNAEQEAAARARLTPGMSQAELDAAARLRR